MAAADGVLPELAAVCPSARAADERDAVAGVVPRYAASPASVAEASALLRAAAAHGLAVAARGGGTKLAWGCPPRRCDLVVHTLGLSEVTEHAAGDLVARVQAGVRMGALAEVLAKAGQQLALDFPPATPGHADATVGGTLATAAAGPRRLRYGTPRDLIIGITVVRPDGVVAHSGGKVVKNVAGYDLGKLFAGSYGTLGLVVEAVFRLHPLPAGTAYITWDSPGAAAACEAVARAAASELAPSAVEIDRPGRGQPVRAGVLLEGDEAGVAERAAQMCALLGDGATTSPGPPAWWGWQPGTDQAGADQAGGDGALAPGGTLIRIAFWPAALAKVLTVIDAAGVAVGLDPAVGGSAAAGVLYAALRPGTEPTALAAFLTVLREALGRGEGSAGLLGVTPADTPPVLANAVVVRAPAEVRDAVDVWGPVPSLALMRAVKDQFDPAHLMAPGRFAGGL
jgi:glycolate oxidase FAD binding subunit